MTTEFIASRKNARAVPMLRLHSAAH